MHCVSRPRIPRMRLVSYMILLKVSFHISLISIMDVLSLVSHCNSSISAMEPCPIELSQFFYGAYSRHCIKLNTRTVQEKSHLFSISDPEKNCHIISFTTLNHFCYKHVQISGRVSLYSFACFSSMS